MALQRVLIVNKTFPTSGLELLKTRVQPTVLPYMDHDPGSLNAIKTEMVNGFDALVWNTKHRLDKEILDLAGPNLKAVSTMASGVDHIDVKELIKRKICVGSTPKVLDNAVADVAVGLLVAAARRFKEGVRELESGEWKYGVQWTLGQDIANSTVGIVGLGGLGQTIVKRLKGFDVAKFIYSGRTNKPEAKILGIERVPIEQLLKESDFIVLSCPLTNETRHTINETTLKTEENRCTSKILGIERVPIEQLLKESDFIVLSCPLTNETRHTINETTLKTMKKTAVLVNVGRGDLVDQKALSKALQEGTIFSAGLDVTTPEPLSKDDPIVGLPNCFIIPHLGSATIQTRNAMARISANNLLLALDGKPMLHPIC